MAETSRILHFGFFWGFLAHASKINQKVFQGPQFGARAGFFRHRLINPIALKKALFVCFVETFASLARLDASWNRMDLFSTLLGASFGSSWTLSGDFLKDV